MLYISTKTRKCLYPNCNFIFLHKLKNNNNLLSSKYCYKHQNEDYYEEITKIENKLFESDLLNFDLILSLKIKITSYFKLKKIKEDIQRILTYYMKLIKITRYEYMHQKYILYLEYSKYLNKIKYDKKEILSKGLIIKDYNFYDNINFFFNRSPIKRQLRGRRGYNTFFFGGIKECKDLYKLKDKLEKDKFESISKQLNFYNNFSEDIEDLIFKYYLNIDLEYDEPFYDTYIQKLKLNLDFNNNIILYLNENKVKFCYMNKK